MPKLQDRNLLRQSYNPGISQSSRANSFLSPKYIQVNELEIEDYLFLTSRFSECVKFYDSHDEQPAGNWSSFFTSDETFFLASVMKFDLENREKEFQLLFSAQTDPLILLEKFNGALIRTLDSWFSQLSLCRGEYSTKLSSMLAEVICQKLSIEYELFSELSKKWNIPVDSWNLNQIWNKSNDTSPYSSQMITMVNKLNTDQCYGIIRSNFFSILAVCKQCRDIADTYFPLTLETEKHSPNSSLFLSFISQLQKNLKNLNKFTGQLEKFYYDSVLKFEPRPTQADSTVITVSETSFPQGAITLPAGTLFTGTEENQNEDLFFRSVKASRLVNAKIAQIVTLSCSKESEIKPESEEDFVTSIQLNHISENCIKSPEENWALFGHTESELVQNGLSPDLGFALTSPSFVLREGNREIIITITCSEHSWRQIDQSINSFANHEKLPKSELFYRVFDHMFTIKISTEEGWYELSEISIYSSITHDKNEPNQIRFHLTIPAGAPATCACDKTVHGNRYCGHWPVVQFLVNYENYLFPYSLLKMFEVEQIEIDTAAQGVKRLKLYSENTPLDPQSLLHPFGAIPSKGSTFHFGSYEMLFKDITDVTISMEWANIPLETQGFEEYYQEYSNSYTNSSFKVKIAELHDSSWHPTEREEEIEVELFENLVISENGYDYVSDRVASHRTISHVSIPEIGKANNFVSEHDYNYSISTRTGFYRMTLSNPEYAFGHSAYSNEIMTTLMKNAKAKIPGQQTIPNLPYTPALKSISLDYTSHEVVNLTVNSETGTATSLFHITPFGKVSVKEKENFTLIEHLNDKEGETYAGNCCIAITPADISGEITLFFNLHNDSLGTSEGKAAPSSRWSYLENNQWKKIDPDMIIEDTTKNFQTDGIVTLVIPHHNVNSNTLLDDSYFWLRISSNISPELSCSVTDLKLNGIPVTRDLEKSKSLRFPLPAGTINKLHKTIPGIQQVNQITPTVQGKKQETSKEMQIRMRERLIHKNRAVTPFDYELIILDKFLDIQQAKCFSNISMKKFKSNKKLTHPGHTLCVVTPSPQNRASLQFNKKMYVNTPDLNEIQTYLQKVTSPFNTIEVANPVYEKIQVRCAVSFVNNKENGLHKRELNEDISRYLSPWYIEGKEISFGWKIRSFELVNYINKLPYVKSVTDFSMLHITDSSDHKYHLFDTTLHDQDQSDEEYRDQSTKDEIVPIFPWSLPLPMEEHFIQVLDHIEEIEPEHVGIKEIRIGRTFIIQDDTDNGKEK